MAKLKQISRNLLPHSATLRKKEEGGAWEASQGEKIELQYILIYGGDTMKYSLNGQEFACNKTLIYDCVNSVPRGVAFRFGDEVKWEGGTYTVKVLNPISTDRNNLPIHHWEVGLA